VYRAASKRLRTAGLLARCDEVRLPKRPDTHVELVHG
jgi:hypothetical protein